MRKNESITFSNMRKKMSSRILDVSDSRQFAKTDYSLHDGIMSGFACMYFQDPSILQFQKRLKTEIHQMNLTAMFDVAKVPKPTQLRTIIDNFDSENFRPIFKDLFAMLQRGKQLEKFRVLDDFYYLAIDGTQYFTSKNLDCDTCLETNHSNGEQSHSHKVLVGGIMHPNISTIIPFYPEEISNSDGSTKQDCEINAAKRLLPKIKQDYSRLNLIIGGDDLYSRQPMIENVLEQNFSYIFVAKESSHKIMYDLLETKNLHVKTVIDDNDITHCYQWYNNIPLNGNKETINTNFFKYSSWKIDEKGYKKVLYSSSWVTDIEIDEDNIEELVVIARRRWGIENECFNTLKKQGYHIEHNYGHGEKNLCFNFLILTLIAFFFQQMFELTNKLYQNCRVFHGSKVHMWESLRSYFKIILFESFDDLLYFSIHSDESKLVFNSS